jgi:hypothetical protein
VTCLRPPLATLSYRARKPQHPLELQKPKSARWRYWYQKIWKTNNILLQTSNIRYTLISDKETTQATPRIQSLKWHNCCCSDSESARSLENEMYKLQQGWWHINIYITISRPIYLQFKSYVYIREQAFKILEAWINYLAIVAIGLRTLKSAIGNKRDIHHEHISVGPR